MSVRRLITHLLADRVDRRVRDLGEALLEVAVQRRAVVGEDREREVVAHRAGRLAAVAEQRREQDPQVLLRVAEGELALQERLDRLDRRHRVGELADAELALCVPLAVGRRAGDRAARARRRCGRDRCRGRRRRAAPGCRRPIRAILFGVVVKMPDSEPRQTQPSRVIIQRPGRRPLRSSIAPSVWPSQKAMAAGPSQGSTQPGVVAVEALELRRGRRRGPPRRRGSSSSSRAAASDRRAPSARARGRTRRSRRRPRRSAAGSRRGRRRSASEERTASRARIQLTLPRSGVDLAVVGDHPQRLGELPARRRVRREARVDDREGAAQRQVAEVGVELRQLRRGQHPLVDDGPAGHARERRRRRRNRARRGGGRRTGCARRRPRRRRPSPASMKSWLICGADSRASSAAGGLVDRDLAPADRPVAGVGDQLARSAAGSARCRRRSRGARSTSRPRASRGRGGRPACVSISAVRERKNSCGSPNMIPAPSPVDSSAPAAPRCSRRSSATRRAVDRLVDRLAVEAGDAGHAAAVVEERRIVDAAEAVLAGVGTGGWRCVPVVSHRIGDARRRSGRCRPGARRNPRRPGRGPHGGPERVRQAGSGRRQWSRGSARTTVTFCGSGRAM